MSMVCRQNTFISSILTFFTSKFTWYNLYWRKVKVLTREKYVLWFFIRPLGFTQYSRDSWICIESSRVTLKHHFFFTQVVKKGAGRGAELPEKICHILRVFTVIFTYFMCMRYLCYIISTIVKLAFVAVSHESIVYLKPK